MKLTRISEELDLLHIACEGEITQRDFAPGEDPLIALAGAGVYGRKLLMNLERATYIDSSGISWLLVCHKHFVEGHGRMVVHSVPPRVDHILQIVRMPLVLHMARDEAAGRALAQGGAP